MRNYYNSRLEAIVCIIVILIFGLFITIKDGVEGFRYFLFFVQTFLSAVGTLFLLALVFVHPIRDKFWLLVIIISAIVFNSVMYLFNPKSVKLSLIGGVIWGFLLFISPYLTGNKSFRRRP
ncbi:hypothetical protein EB093_08280 [bacterium]|nr:hypothetical protein [bacterium]